MNVPKDPKEPDEPIPPLSSTLQYVKAVQGEGDTEVSWSNLHDKVVRWVGEATAGQNLPTDKSTDDLTQEVLMQVFRDIAEFKVEPGASFSGWVRMIAHRKLN
ncbi:MAG: sigma factor, partial [Planctomycetota bacterium]